MDDSFTSESESAQQPGMPTTTGKVLPQPSIPGTHKRLLTAIKKDAVFTYIARHCEVLTPYEMRQALDPEETGELAEAYVTRFVPTIEGFRNVLVVTPLTVTWLSLAIAAAAYQQFLHGFRGTTPPTFFQVWQEGFPGLTYVVLARWHIPLTIGSIHIFRFMDVALIDFLLLATLLLLTAWAQIRVAYANGQARKLQIWLEEQLFQLSQHSVTASLNPGDKDKPRWAVEVQYALNALNNALEGVKTTVQSFERSLRTQGNVVQNMLDNSGDITRTVTTLTGIYQQIMDASQTIDNLLPRIESHISSISGDQQDTSLAWRNMTMQLQQTADGITALAGVLTGDPHLYQETQHFQRQYDDSYSHRLEPTSRGRIRSWLGRLTGK